MSQDRPRPLNDMSPQPRPWSADFVEPAKNSMLYTMLPSAVQNRLPRLPSLRKSVSMYGIAVSRKSCDDSASRPTTPPSGYASAMVLSASHTIDTQSTEMSAYYETQQTDERSISSKPQQSLDLSETQSGIGWKFANQGLNLLGLAIEESATMSQDPSSGNASFSRQLYIHALTYLLRGLPSDLAPDERMSIRGALPKDVVEPLQVNGINEYTNTSTTSPRQSPSLLHKTLASTIVQIFILLQFILPYVKYLLATAYQYERTHRISEKFLHHSLDTVDVVGKRSLTFTGAIYGMADGKVGQALTETATWLVEGITGGIHEGVGEGLNIMAKKRED